MIMKDKVSHGVSKAATALALVGAVLLAPGLGDQDGWSKDDAKAYAKAADDKDATKALIGELFDEGEQLFRAGEYPASMDVFKELLAIAPDHGMAHARMGYMSISLRMLPEATWHFQREMELKHGMPTASYNLACCAALGGDVKAGLEHLARSIRLGFDQAELMKTDSDLENLRGTPSFEAAVKLAAKLAELRAALAQVDAQADPERALTLYRGLTMIASEDPAPLPDYALLMHTLGDYAGSEAAWRKQAELGLDPGMATYNIGCAQALTGRTDEAFKSLFEAAELGFSYPALVADSDLVSLHGDKRWPKAVKALSASKEFIEKVRATRAKGDHEQALRQLDELLAGGQVDAKARGWADLMAGETLAELGRYEEALARYEAALEADFEPGAAHFGMGQAYSALGREDKALAMLEKALKLGYPGDEGLAEAAAKLDAIAAEQAYAADLAKATDAAAEAAALYRLDVMRLELDRVRNDSDIARAEAETVRRELERLREDQLDKRKDEDLAKQKDKRKDKLVKQQRLDKIDQELRSIEAARKELEKRAQQLEEKRRALESDAKERQKVARDQSRGSSTTSSSSSSSSSDSSESSSSSSSSDRADSSDRKGRSGRGRADGGDRRDPLRKAGSGASSSSSDSSDSSTSKVKTAGGPFVRLQ